MIELILPRFDGLEDRVGAFSTTRKGGFSRAPFDDGAGGGGLNLGLHVDDMQEHVRRNRVLLRSLLPAEPAWLSQVHGIEVADAAKLTGSPQADASITTTPGVVCAVQTADCLPVLFCDAAGKVVGAAHAGWRGLAAGVLERTVERMREAGAQDILAWLGPAIGLASFEVGQEVFDTFAARHPRNASAFSMAGRSGKYLADIYALARLALGAAGVTGISGGDFCTMTQPQHFYSYRRDGKTGRMASLIWLK